MSFLQYDTRNHAEAITVVNTGIVWANNCDSLVVVSVFHMQHQPADHCTISSYVAFSTCSMYVHVRT